MGFSFRLAARVLLYAPSHRQDSTYHDLCYTSRGALAGMRNSSMGSPHEGSIRRPIAPWANALTTELHLRNDSARKKTRCCYHFMGYSLQLAARNHCCTSCGAMGGTRKSSMGAPMRDRPNDLSHCEWMLEHGAMRREICFKSTPFNNSYYSHCRTWHLTTDHTIRSWVF